jgi:hypothetical protein
VTPTSLAHRHVAGDGRTEDRMRSITLRQPWAWAVASGVKTVENRMWGTALGTVAIHAGLRFDSNARQSEPLMRAWKQAADQQWMPGLHQNPTGVILGLVDIVDIHMCDPVRGCYRDADVLGWVPWDGADVGGIMWRPRFCSTWAEVPAALPRGTGARQRHWTLANARPLDHPIQFGGHQGIRLLDTRVVQQVQARLKSQEWAR